MVTLVSSAFYYLNHKSLLNFFHRFKASKIKEKISEAATAQLWWWHKESRIYAIVFISQRFMSYSFVKFLNPLQLNGDGGTKNNHIDAIVFISLRFLSYSFADFLNSLRLSSGGGKIKGVSTPSFLFATTFVLFLGYHFHVLTLIKYNFLCINYEYKSLFFLVNL